MVYFNESVSARCWPNVELVSSTLGKYRFDVVPVFGLVLNRYWIGILGRYNTAMMWGRYLSYIGRWDGIGPVQATTLCRYWSCIGPVQVRHWADTGPVQVYAFWAGTGSVLGRCGMFSGQVVLISLCT